MATRSLSSLVSVGVVAAAALSSACGSSDHAGGSDSGLIDTGGVGVIVGSGDAAVGIDGGPASSEAGASPEAGPTLVNPCIEAGTCTPPVACASLSTVVGTWQNISPTQFVMPANMETLAVAVNPEDETVFAAAGNVTNGPACPSGQTCPSGSTGLLKSSDCGSTWTLVTNNTPGSDSANLFTGDPWALLIDPVQPQTLYMNNGYGNEPTIYKSTNGGVD